MEIPSNHQGIPLPPRKNSEELLPAVLDATHPIDKTMIKKMPTIIQSIVCSTIWLSFILKIRVSVAYYFGLKWKTQTSVCNYKDLYTAFIY
jgi:hypothetical protein